MFVPVLSLYVCVSSAGRGFLASSLAAWPAHAVDQLLNTWSLCSTTTWLCQIIQSPVWPGCHRQLLCLCQICSCVHLPLANFAPPVPLVHLASSATCQPHSDPSPVAISCQFCRSCRAQPFPSSSVYSASRPCSTTCFKTPHSAPQLKSWEQTLLFTRKSLIISCFVFAFESQNWMVTRQITVVLYHLC